MDNQFQDDFEPSYDGLSKIPATVQVFKYAPPDDAMSREWVYIEAVRQYCERNYGWRGTFRRLYFYVRHRFVNVSLRIRSYIGMQTLSWRKMRFCRGWGSTLKQESDNAKQSS